MAWDAPTSAIIRRWVEAVRFKSEIVVLFLDDITINRHATLAVAGTAKSLLARNIYIHRTGQLVQHGSYLKIWANSINQFRGFLDPAKVASLHTAAFPWQLAD